MGTEVIKLILALLLVASPAFAGSIIIRYGTDVSTFTTTAEQDARLQSFMVDFNAIYDPDGDTLTCVDDPDDQCLTVSSYLMRTMSRRAIAAIRSQEGKERGLACVNFRALSVADRNTIRAQLGNKSPCLPPSGGGE